MATDPRAQILGPDFDIVVVTRTHDVDLAREIAEEEIREMYRGEGYDDGDELDERVENWFQEVTVKVTGGRWVPLHPEDPDNWSGRGQAWHRGFPLGAPGVTRAVEFQQPRYPSRSVATNQEQ